MKHWILFIILMFFVVSSCADNLGSGSSGDSTGDTVTVTIPADTDDEDLQDDATGDTTTIEVPANELLSKINLTGSTLALKQRDQEFSLFERLYNTIITPAYASVECNELGTLDGDQYEALTVEGSTPCFSDVEIWNTGQIYAKYFLQDQSQSPSLMSVEEQVIFSIITDNQGNVHHLPGHPIKKNSFKNSKVIESYQGKPVYINSGNKLVSFDVSTDSESIIIDEPITNFSIKDYSDGSHFVVDATSGVKRIKPDNSEDLLTEITKGDWHNIDGSIQYVSQSKFKRMIFDIDGNITDRTAYSYPETFQAWLDAGSGAMPTGIPFDGSVSDCSNNIIGDQRIMICNGKAFRVKEVDEDLEEINWVTYGHPAFDSWDTVKLCSNSNSMYFYSQSVFNGNRLTWINDSSGQFRDILDTHQITDLECISDSEVAVIGTVDDLIETLIIKNANTISPTILIIDSRITDIITQ